MNPQFVNPEDVTATMPEDVFNQSQALQAERQKTIQGLPTFGETMYRSAADVIGTPIDLAAMALSPFGYSEKAPIGGSEYFKQMGEQKGIISSASNPAMEIAASLMIPDPLDVLTVTKMATPMLLGMVGMSGDVGRKMGTKSDDLIIQHNLSEANLAHAEAAGGLPVPSLAITNKGTPLEGFGEITMLGDKALAKPSKEHRVFGSDVYSPRHPKEYREYKRSDINFLDNTLTDYQSKLGGSDGVRESGDVQDLENNLAFKLKFLEEEKGIKIDIPSTKNENYDVVEANYPDELQLAKEGNFDWLQEYRKPEFIEKVTDDLNRKLKVRGRDEDALSAYGEEGIINIARDRAQTIEGAAKYQGKPDRYEARKIIDNELKDYKDEFTNYTDEFKEGYPYKSTFTEDGKTRAYSERNIISFLKKDLRGGENYNYGAGSVRAMVTPEYKTIDEIVANKNNLVSSEDMDKVKEEMNNNLQSLAAEIASPKESNPFIASDIAIEFIQDYATRGKRAIDDYLVEVDDDKLNDIDEFLDSLKDAPTEYFESKVLKRMDLGEFKYAVIPNNASEKTKNILDKKGIEYSTYDPKLEGNRIQEIQKAAEENGYLFALPLTIGLGAMHEDDTNDSNL